MKNFFKDLWKKIRRQSDESRFDLLVRYSDVAVRVTSALKKFAEGKVDNFIVTAIAGNKGDAIWAIVESQIPHFATKTALVNGIIKSGKNNQDPVVAIAKYIQTLHIEGKEEFYAKFAARLVLDIAEAKSDGKFEFAEVLSISQARFLELKKEGLL
jgi:RNase P/RNase MRP subunit POP5